MKIDKKAYSGLFPAVFTPMHENGHVNLDQIQPIVDHLVADGVRGLYICGSTGEGPSLTSDERMAVAESYIQAARGRLLSIVQVGHESLAEAKRLAVHAASLGADAISAMPPTYFPIKSEEELIRCLRDIASSTPEIPLFYYHIPGRTHVHIDLFRFLEICVDELPTLVGVKYSATTIYEFQQCLEFDNRRYVMLFGCDEMLLSALCVGAPGAVGSTYNFAAPLYHDIIKAAAEKDLDKAGQLQAQAATMVRVLQNHGGGPAIKSAMSLIGLECGPVRLPQSSLSAESLASLRNELDSIGFFQSIARRSI